MHTHATESFEPYDSEIYDTRHTWRSTDNSENIVAAGEVMAQAIRSHGIEVLHDDTQHDYPSYNGSYERSAETVKEYLAKYPSIKVVLDVHRDAVQRDSTLVKPVTQINGKKAAQMMIIASCDDGTMEMPNWGKNLRFAAGIQDAIESRWQGLTRPIFFCYRKYNQDLTTGSLLLELGSHGNTLEQVLTTAQLAGDAIGNYLAQECMAEHEKSIPFQKEIKNNDWTFMEVYTIIKTRAIIILTFSLIVLIPTGQNVGIDPDGYSALPFAIFKLSYKP